MTNLSIVIILGLCYAGLFTFGWCLWLVWQNRKLNRSDKPDEIEITDNTNHND